MQLHKHKGLNIIRNMLNEDQEKRHQFTLSGHKEDEKKANQTAFTAAGSVCLIIYDRV